MHLYWCYIKIADCKHTCIIYPDVNFIMPVVCGIGQVNNRLCIGNIGNNSNYISTQLAAL